MYSSFWGAVAVGRKVIFAPYWADDVGVLHISTKTFSSLSTRKFWGAVALTLQWKLLSRTLDGPNNIRTSLWGPLAQSGGDSPQTTFLVAVIFNAFMPSDLFLSYRSPHNYSVGTLVSDVYNVV